jgi:hypothetical protein
VVVRAQVLRQLARQPPLAGRLLSARRGVLRAVQGFSRARF